MVFELLSGPPASGKKEYLTDKIRDYIRENRNTEDVLVLTNKSSTAREIRDAVVSGISSYTQLWVESISSFAKKILRENYFHAGLNPGFRIISDFEKRMIIRNILKRDIRLRFFSVSRLREGLIRELANFIDLAKRNGIGPDDCGKRAGAKLHDISLVYELYRKTLKSSNYIDLVDLIGNTEILLERNPDLAGFKAVFVYEAEDMDRMMAGILRSVLGKAERAVISLDRESEIYRFRGSDPAYMEDILTKNFNISRVTAGKKKLEPEIKMIRADTRLEQAGHIASHIALKLKNGVAPDEIAIVSRSVGEDLWVFMEALKEKGINSMLLGGIGFFRQPEIIKLISLLTVVNEGRSAEDIHLYRSIQLAGTLDSDGIDMLRKKSLDEGIPLRDVFSADFPDLSEAFWGKIDEQTGLSKHGRAEKFVYGLMTEYEFFSEAVSDRFLARLYGYFFDVVRSFSEHYTNMNRTALLFPDFMDNLYDLLSSSGKDMDIPYIPDQEAVRIMTVNQAKGSLFRVAYVVDMTEDNFPRPFFDNPLLSAKEMEAVGIYPVPGIKAQYEHEKRLYNVAAARAEEELVFCSYDYDDGGAITEVSSFISSLNLPEIQSEINGLILDEKDFLLKMSEELPCDDFPLLDASPALRTKIDSLDAILRLDRKMLSDKVSICLPERYSYSLLESFRKCPRYFFIRHILRLREPENLYRVMGIAVHRLLCDMHKNDVMDISVLEKMLDEILGSMHFSSLFEKRNLRRIMYAMAENYVERMKNADFKITGLEENFVKDLDGIRLAGRFDRVDRLAGGHKRVVDYKTGKNVPGRQAFINAVERGDNFQVPIYSWASGARYFTIYRLREPPEKMEVEMDMESDKALKAMKKAKEHLADTVSSIASGIFLPGEKKDSCRQCYYRRICDI
ncbi:MAG: ATP-dependent helicase [Elusimicrobia bacterium]|nr:ATP-dependent helicase [Elusimicrobiota bacterium]